MHFNGYAFENALCEHAGCLVSTIMGIYQIARRQLWVVGRPYVVDAKAGLIQSPSQAFLPVLSA